MLKSNQWIVFGRNVCVWYLLREFVSGVLPLSEFETLWFVIMKPCVEARIQTFKPVDVL
jgi:hypothetical protein